MSKSNQSDKGTNSGNSAPAILSPGSIQYKTVVAAFYRGTYNVDNSEEVYRKELIWLEGVLEKALSKEVPVVRERLFIQAKITRFLESAGHLRAMALGKEPEGEGVYVNQERIRDIVETYNNLTNSKGKNTLEPGRLNMLASVMEIEAVKHCMRLFTLDEQKLNKVNKNDNAESLRSKKKLKLKHSIFPEFTTFRSWYFEQNFLKESKFQSDETRLELAYENHVNSFTYAYKRSFEDPDGAKKVILSNFPDDIIPSIRKYLEVNDSGGANIFDTLSNFDKRYCLQKVDETLCYKPRSCDKLLDFVSNENQAYSNLTLLDLRYFKFSDYGYGGWSKYEQENFERIMKWVKELPHLRELKISMDAKGYGFFLEGCPSSTKYGSVNLFGKVVELNLNFASRSQFEMAYVRKHILSTKKFKNLKTLQFAGLGSKEHFNELCKIILQKEKAFFKGVAIEISGINQNWTTFDEAKKLLQNNQNLSLSFENLNVVQEKRFPALISPNVPNFTREESNFWPEGITEIIIPERFRWEKAFYVQRVPKLHKLHFPKRTRFGEKLIVHGNDKLAEVTFSKNADLEGAKIRIVNNKSLRKVEFEQGVYKPVKKYCSIEIVDNNALKEFVLSKNMDVASAIVARNNALEVLNFPERFCTFDSVRILENKELQEVNFSNGAKIFHSFTIYNNPLLDTITYGRDVSTRKFFLSNYSQNFLSSLFHAVPVKFIYIDEYSKFKQSDFFLALLLNRNLKSKDICSEVYTEDYIDSDLRYPVDKKWFDLRDKILKTAEDANANIASHLSSEEINLVGEAKSHIDAYLAKHCSGKNASNQSQIVTLERLSASIEQSKNKNVNDHNKESVSNKMNDVFAELSVAEKGKI